jgi:hypothetical protein
VDGLPDILRHVEPGQKQIPPEQWDALVDAATRGNLGAGGYADSTGTVYRSRSTLRVWAWQFAQLTTSLVTWNSTLLTGSTLANGTARAAPLVALSGGGWAADPNASTVTVYAPPMMGANDFLPSGSYVMIQWFADPVQPGWYVVASNCYTNS